ncbi:Uncharacterized conserved protein YdeI, YjbR/CyaY-like superfamily, DUF1801 family [Colwellia chukchiensis]|uniref:Uncharacterized conserved protein YdeI, YjbR/CyaY-like superfamily, DUF1801 family n=1 Tax=Colwellia chukchiensis TaxID=641665 RepID=A0A1H7JJQ4_9GAMM|nr:YdeI/OmpD-associated family protein [Colwellia chukchiensis]SEK74801.1 Uncharacterized conserved protein YdeI, YjbR/CyaY-like superfamily, DUF1801 family [Colwellia chukchiensis]
MSKNTAVDEYINSKPPFAQEILRQLRTVIHSASPALTETIKWRQPCFEQHGVVCAMAAFKHHVSLSFFKGKLINDSAGIFADSDNNELTSLKFNRLAYVPEQALLIDYIQQAIAINNDSTVKKTSNARKDKSTLIIPEDLAQALAKAPKAYAVFHDFSYSKQKDYIDWLNTAKRDATRNSRLTTTLQWLSEGKARNWKYENC